MREGLALVDRPRARWAFERRPKVRLDAVLRRNDPLRDVVRALRRDRHVQPVAASKDVTASGTRYAVDFTTLDRGEPASVERVVVDVGPDGSVRSIRGAYVAGGGGSAHPMRATYEYGPQRVKRPRPDRTAPRRLLAGGCRAVQTRELVRSTAEAVAQQANEAAARRSVGVTVVRVRRVAARLTERTGGLRIRAREVRGGAELVGRHRFLDAPERRRVVVVGGRAVVRRR